MSRLVFSERDGRGKHLDMHVDTSGVLIIEITSYGLDCSIDRENFVVRPEGANLLTEKLSREYPRKYKKDE